MLIALSARLRALFLFCLLAGMSLLKAQTLTEDESVPIGYFTPEHVLAPLDLAEVPSGLLADQALPLTDLGLYDGAVPDAPTVTPTRMQLIYAMLYDAACSETVAPEPTALGEPLRQGEAFPLRIMLYEYDRLKPTALDEGLVQISNNQVHDISGPEESPYERQQVFAATPWYEGLLNGDSEYHFTPELVSNMGDDITALSIDFGSGYQSLTLGQSFTVQTAYGGPLHLRIRVELSDGTLLYSNSVLGVREVISALTPDGYGNWVTEQLYPEQEANPVDGEFDHISFLTACEDGMIRRPLLIISGFETPLLDEVIENDLEKVDQLLRATSPTNNRLLEDFESSGYDLVFLQFYDETNSLRANAEVVKDAIRLVNERKVTDEELVIAGVSMGGPLGMLALREMELAGEEHETRLFITVDSPLRGGNIPLGYQAAVYELGDIDVGPLGFGTNLSNIVSFLGDARATLERESPSEMLIYHYGHIKYGAGPNNYRDFYDYFTSLGALEKCELMTVSDGSQIGLGQNFNAGDLMLHIRGTSGQYLEERWNLPGFFSVLFDLVSNIALGTGAISNVKVWAVPNQSEGRIYRGFLAARILALPVVFQHTTISIAGTIPVDSAPGGTSSTGDLSETPLVQEFQSHFCFIPTVSGLEVGPFQGLDVPLSDPFADVSDNETVLGLPQTTMKYLVAADEPNVYAEEIGGNTVLFDNIEHPIIIGDLAGVVLSKTINGTVLNADLIGRTFNFGNSGVEYDYANPPEEFPIFRTEPIIDQDISIGAGGVLWVNGNDLIEYTDNPANLANATRSHYAVRIISGYCNGDPTIVSVKEGGLIEVGDWNGAENTGSVGVYQNASLLINTGGKVNLNHNADLFIKSGGTVEVDDGAELHASFGGRITVENGGSLRIKSGAELRLSQYSALEVQAGGTLILEDGAKVQLWDGAEPNGEAVIRVKGLLQLDGQIDFSGNGYFHFFPSHDLLSSSEFTLVGMGQEFRFIELENYTRLMFGATDLELRSGRIVYGIQAKIEQTPGASLRLANTRHDGADAAIGVSASGLSSLTVTSCIFNELSYGLELYDLVPSSTIVNSLISNSRFMDCETAVQVDEADQIFIQGSTFAGGTHALLLNRVRSARLSNSEITGFVNPHSGSEPVWGAVYLSDVPEFVVSGGNIHNNDIGIYAPAMNLINGGLNQSNVILRAQATVSDNTEYGIFMEKGGTDANGLDYGLVLMDCANLLDNSTGIGGVDVLLQIDAIENSGTPNPQYWRSNSFRRAPNGLLFDICYRDRDDVLEVTAQGNYWFDADIESNIFSQHRLQNAELGSGCAGHYPNILLDVSNFVIQQPSGCPVGPPLGEDGYPTDKDCEIMDESGTSPLIIVEGNLPPGEAAASYSYRTAYQAFESALANEGPTSDARQQFLAMAGVPELEREQSSTLCQKLVDVSRVLSVDDYEDPLLSNGSNFQGLIAAPESENTARLGWEIAVVPNPSAGDVVIHLTETQGVLELYNATGELVLQNMVSDYRTTLGLTSLPGGVYFLQWKSIKGELLQVAKVVLHN